MAYNLFFNISIIMSVINLHRQNHCVLPLKWNSTLSHIAQNWSDTLAETDELFHSHSPYGETLALVNSYGNDQTHSIITSINLWYSEIMYYNWSSPKFDYMTGHFTQLIWRDTTDVGFGVAINIRGQSVVSAEYYPPGNIASPIFFENNVKPLCSLPPLPTYPPPKPPLPKYPLPKSPLPKYPSPKYPSPRPPLPKYPLPKSPLPKYPSPKPPLPKYPLPKSPLPKYPSPKYSSPNPPRPPRRHRHHRSPNMY